jgi:hypothetical protein
VRTTALERLSRARMMTVGLAPGTPGRARTTLRGARLALVVVTAVGCVSAPALDAALERPAPAQPIRFGVDTFAFANEGRAKNRGKPDLFANYCFVMARAVTQFRQSARFDPTAVRLRREEYTARVKEVLARAPWDNSRAPDDRVVIPGYASLHDLSRDETAAVKAGLVGRVWTWVHWTNWRVVLPMSRDHQEGVATESIAELQAGRPVQWLISDFVENFPDYELNHTVVVFDYRVNGGGAVEFVVYDPNDPALPGLITFDRQARRFVATRVFDTPAGPIRAWRMYYSPLL